MRGTSIAEERRPRAEYKKKNTLSDSSALRRESDNMSFSLVFLPSGQVLFCPSRLPLSMNYPGTFAGGGGGERRRMFTSSLAVSRHVC